MEPNRWSCSGRPRVIRVGRHPTPWAGPGTTHSGALGVAPIPTRNQLALTGRLVPRCPESAELPAAWYRVRVCASGHGCTVTASESAESPSIYPERIGRYELLLPIGTGGMATVHLARTAVVGDLYREVALKLMHAHLSAEEGEWSTHLLEEAKLAARIRHPNVVAVLEVGEGPHGVFLVMEYVEGDTLSGLLRVARGRGHTLPLATAGRILIDSLAGLHAAHELTDEQGSRLDLVHRDFSPQNIMVGSDGISRLTDFGIAKATGRAGVTSSGIIKGKVGYMAPEQALGKRVDRRCDVWAAGVVAWELLAGRRLYKHEDQVSTLLRIVQEPPPRLRSVRTDVPPALEQVVAAALTMDVDQRIPSAIELRRQLVAAWRAESEIADTSEVGDLVRDLAGSKLEKRRAQVGQVLKLREKMARVSRSAIQTANADMGAPSYNAHQAHEETSGEASSGITSPSEIAALHALPTLPPGVAARSRRGRFIWLSVAAATAGAAAIALFALGGPSPESPAAAASSGAQTGSPQVSLAPLGSAAPPPPSAPAPAAPSDKPLAVQANAPIAKLQIDGRSIQIPKPTRQLSVPLDAAERRETLAVEAASSDGRRVSVEVAGDTEKLEISFPRAVGVARPPGPVRSSTPKRPDPPGLAPTPYGTP
jgi:eukaryotic-like serine/threonine-protein kinase